MSCIFPTSHFTPSLTKISEGSKSIPRDLKSPFTIASRKNEYPCSGPYPLKVSIFPISKTAFCIALITTGAKGCVTSPIPNEIILVFECSFLYASILFLISANR